MPATPWWTCAQCETVLRAGMSSCWECSEAAPSNAAPGDPRRKESGAVLVYLQPEDARTVCTTLWKGWGGSDQEQLAEQRPSGRTITATSAMNEATGVLW